MPWRLLRRAGCLAAAALVAWTGLAPASRSQAPLDVVATGVPRPLAMGLDGSTLVVLSPGSRGDSAGELYRIDLASPRPVDLSPQPRMRIPFRNCRPATLGSLAIDPVTREIFLGEENGTAVYRLTSAELYRLTADGTLGAFVRLPHGQYNRIHMVATPDGSVLVSGGFHIGQMFRVSRDGEVSVVAGGLADPQGIAVDRQRDVYVADRPCIGSCGFGRCESGSVAVSRFQSL